MRKIYSLVLMATMLLVGTNVWGDDITVVNHTKGWTKSFADLQVAIDSVYAGDSATITLSDDVDLDNGPIVIPHVTGTINTTTNKNVLTRDPQIINLNLGGHELYTDDANACIHFLKGTLRISNGKVSRKGVGAGSNNWSKSVIVVAGAPWTQKNTVWTVLEIGQDVEVKTATTPGFYGITIQDMDNANNLGFYSTLGYTTYYRGTGTGSASLNNLTSFSNSNYDGAISCSFSSDPQNASTKGYYQAGCAYGVKVLIKGKVFASQRAIYSVGHVNAAPQCDINDQIKKRQTTSYPYYSYNYPYVNIASTAEVWCTESGLSSGNGGIYSGGYVVFDVSGYVHGQTGILMKSGDLVLNDAVVASDASTASNSGNYGGNVSGSGIFIASDGMYAGSTAVTIEGDTKVSGNGSAAITDQLADNTEGESYVSHLTIESGTIEPGDGGAINLQSDDVDKTTVSGGNISGVIIVENNETGETTTTPVTTLTDNNTSTVTTVTDETGKTTYVITPGKSSNIVESANVYAATKDSVKWTGDSEILADNKTLGYLEINEMLDATNPKTQVLTIPQGKTLTVGRVVLGHGAQIIVEAGAKFIVTGTQGIVAPSVDNILLKTSETAQATFLFNPAVTSNRHPNATVEFASRGKYDGTEGYYWQRFCIPTQNLPKANLSDNSASKTPYGSSAIFTAIYQWSYANNAWERIDQTDYTLESFRMYNMTNSSASGDVTYEFKGGLCGNVNDNLDFVMGYNFFGNSYNAPMDVETLLGALTDGRISHTVYLWDVAGQRYQDFPKDAYGTIVWPSWGNQIPSMQTFAFQQIYSGDVNVAVDYSDLVWDTRNKAYTAPSRQNVNSDFFRINISDANNHKDQVTFVIDSKYTADFDNGGDANKLMANDMINIYASTENGMQSTVAADDVLGTMLSLQTKDEETYMITFSCVTSDAYALRDTQTGTVTNIVDGGVYCFSTIANSTIENRFEIVARQEMPTDIETIENVNMNNGSIFTITGQYVGEADSWFTLPAGMYIMNGQKVIK